MQFNAIFQRAAPNQPTMAACHKKFGGPWSRSGLENILRVRAKIVYTFQRNSLAFPWEF
jgi:hypothetical protein